jgi:hypothetical protein
LLNRPPPKPFLDSRSQPRALSLSKGIIWKKFPRHSQPCTYSAVYFFF